jgi:hypothetical protein
MRPLHVPRFLLLALLSWALPAMTEEQSKQVFPALQAVASKLVELPSADVADRRFASLVLNRQPVLVSGARVDAVRLRVPAGGGDLVWAFAIPRHCSSWYIIPATGSGPGFTNFMPARHWREATWPSDPSYRPFLQALPAAQLKPGNDYLIWFEFTTEAPATVHAAARFAPSLAGEWAVEAMEKVLGLTEADVDLRSERFDTRGGRLLRDPKLLDQPFGALRLHSLLNLIDGIPIAIASAPGRLPSIRAVAAKLGPADLVLDHDALLAAGIATLGGGEVAPGTSVELAKGMRSALFDHVVITAASDEAPAENLTVQAWDASVAAARTGEDALDHLPGGWTLAHSRKRLVAILRDLGGPSGLVTYGSLHAGTWRGRSDAGWVDEEVIVDVAGDGSREIFNHPGMRSQRFTLRAWRYQGEGIAWYDVTRKRAVVNYRDGLLDGEAVWYAIDGTIEGRATYRAGKRQPVAKGAP